MHSKERNCILSPKILWCVGSMHFCAAHIDDVKIIFSFLWNADEVMTLAAEYEVGLTTALRRLAKLSEHILEREQSQRYWSVT
jgi:hypothetical protein